MYDIFFISYNEPNADKNFNLLKLKFPTSQRIYGIKGISQAHQTAAKKSFTKMFWVVDADAIILDTFEFNYNPPDHQMDHVHVWRSRNPVNELIYGYGGVKLLPKTSTSKMDLNGIDMTTSISSLFKSMDEVSNITEFNTDPFNTWKSAFRECVKLSSKVIDRQRNDETEQRLSIWCTKGNDKPFGEYAISGAIAGKEYGIKNKNNKEGLKKINDFDWLEQEFKKHYE